MQNVVSIDSAKRAGSIDNFLSPDVAPPAAQPAPRLPGYEQRVIAVKQLAEQFGAAVVPAINDCLAVKFDRNNRHGFRDFLSAITAPQGQSGVNLLMRESDRPAVVPATVGSPFDKAFEAASHGKGAPEIPVADGVSIKQAKDYQNVCVFLDVK